MADNDCDKNKTNVDDILSKFDCTGRYHFRIFSLILLCNVFNGIFTLNYVFSAQSSTYRCKGGENNETCSVNGTSCSEWIYDNPDSFVAEFQLACQEWKRTLVGTMHSCGYMVGLLIIGPVADRLGRKIAVVVTGVAGGLVGVAKSFATSYWLFVGLEFFEGVVGDAFSPSFNLAVEFVTKEKRAAFVLWTNVGYPVGYIIMALVAWKFQYWRTYLRVVYAPALIYLVYIFFIDESPRWLLSKGKTKEAKEILIKAANTNKIIIDKSSLDNMSIDKENKISLTKLLKITLSSKKLLKRFLICVVWWITCTFIHYGLAINTVSLAGNKYLNFILSGVIASPGIFLTIFMLNNLSRKVLLTLSFFLCALLCLTQPFVPENLLWLAITIYLLGKFFGTLSFLTTYLYTSELFPTYTRNSMHALCSSLGRVGSILAPQTPLLLKYWNGLPPLAFGGMALIAGLLTLLVPDTTDNALPDTVEQAEVIGKTVQTEKDKSIAALKAKQCNFKSQNTYL